MVYVEIPSADVADDEVLSEYLGGLRLPDGGGAVGVGVAHPDEGGGGAVHPLAGEIFINIICILNMFIHYTCR